MTQAGFEYQSSSGYWWDPKSGYFYDAKTQLYYHHSTNQWYQYNQDTGQYVAVGGEQQQQNGETQQQQQQGPAEGAAGALQGQQQQQKQVSAADKRRRAVIGSKPQYNPEGLLAAAALAEVRAFSLLPVLAGPFSAACMHTWLGLWYGPCPFNHQCSPTAAVACVVYTSQTDKCVQWGVAGGGGGAWWPTCRCTALTV